MKQQLALIAFIILFACKVSAQNAQTKNDTAKRQTCAGQNISISTPLKTILSKDAAKHIGEFINVCDQVFTTRLIVGSNTILLDIGGNYPNQTLTVLIKSENRSKFKEQPEVYYKGKNVCVFGDVTAYKGRPELEVKSPYQLNIRDH
ncbi:MAG: hypothetical protein EOP43_02590 [Sphingobacteriaceae bacterium]|nr:MAG: hypothetical protein EOP43_02590 [Sphingobacteriaceae bacterium]